MKTFHIPIIYRSPLITAIKNKRKQLDKMKKDFTPTLLDFGPLQIHLARHFGFCYGVENAIEISFRTLAENPDKRIFLLSEMIHNPHVNADLQEKGIRFLQDNYGKQLIPFGELKADDIVIIPAFGTTLETESLLHQLGIQTEKYNTTCPFVEKVWNRSAQIAERKYTVVVHGKPEHEETRATFSHASSHTPAVIVNNMEEAHRLAAFITGKSPAPSFYEMFRNQYSKGFNVEKDLERIGVVNQTTMLASETQAIADFLRQTMISHFHLEDHMIAERFADTRDTLCYATNDNQTAVTAMLRSRADLAIVIGGYNSSNTTHLVELCENILPTFFINDEEKILSRLEMLHFDIHSRNERLTTGWLPSGGAPSILITSGASCPDALVESVIEKIIGFFPEARGIHEMIAGF
ncbi:MAG: 4-hydroxy-3-methylbut-2-enyl diphosphate reductase [Chitinophagales bacterium]